jgi:fused signal recognition particle receptor
MTFDWFRRQYKQHGEQLPAAEPEQPQPESEPSQEVPPAATEAAPAISEDYLNWAKAAYKNIQKRQQESQTIPPPVTAAPEPVAPTDQGVAQTSPSMTGVEEDLSKAVIAPATPATEPTERPTPENLAAPEPELSPEPEPASPFWSETETERQARLKQLWETAIADLETKPSPSGPAVPTTVTAPGSLEPGELTLDEGFLWSSEILAAQGRRPEDISPEEITWLNRLRQGLGKTRRGLINQLRAIVGQGPLNQDAVLEIEAVLLQADVGVEATDAIIGALQKKLRDEVLPPEAAMNYLKQIMRDMLDTPLNQTHNAIFAPQKNTLNIWLITGVNGAGKTTTIGKLAHLAQKSDYQCLIAAADTFRAAAVEQVKVWGRRSGVEVIANPGKNADPAAVVFDAITAAKARGTELLLVDTAGRLQNKKNLMEELSKIRRIIDRKASDAVVESLLVLDSSLGQNGLRQAQVFSEVAKLSGVVLTKLDGTAKGGVALAVVQQLSLPIRFIGAGEGIEDLRPFSSYEFVEALLNG